MSSIVLEAMFLDCYLSCSMHEQKLQALAWEMNCRLMQKQRDELPSQREPRVPQRLDMPLLH